MSDHDKPATSWLVKKCGPDDDFYEEVSEGKDIAMSDEDLDALMEALLATKHFRGKVLDTYGPPDKCAEVHPGEPHPYGGYCKP